MEGSEAAELKSSKVDQSKIVLKKKVLFNLNLQKLQMPLKLFTLS